MGDTEAGDGPDGGGGTADGRTEPAREIVVCCRHLVVVDLGTVDALGRIAVAARRLGTSVTLRDVSVELRELLDLVGLELSAGGRLQASTTRPQLLELPLPERER